MPFEKRESNWLKIPKIGESYDFFGHGEIVTIQKVEGKKGFNFIEKVALVQNGIPVVGSNGQPIYEDKDLGYRYEVTFADGKKLSISSWSVYNALSDAEVVEGDKIMINHPEKGVWKIEKIN